MINILQDKLEYFSVNWNSFDEKKIWKIYEKNIPRII